MVNDTVTTEKGASLSRGPALVLGTVLLAVGLYALYRQHTFPPFSNFPNGNAPVGGKVLFGIFGANGWTGMLTAVGGGLLLFGAAQHLLAKTMSLIVGVALGAAAIIALISNNVLGMAAANHLTEIGWGASAVILLFNTLIPRRRRTVAAGAAVGTRTTGASDRSRVRHREEGAAVAGAGAGALAEHHRDERVREREQGDRAGLARDEQATAVHSDGSREPTVAHDPAGERTVAHDPAGERTVAHDPAEGRTVAHDPAEEGTVAHDPAESERERIRSGSED